MRYKMTIEPITFIHIGSGSEIDILNYAIVEDKFYRINISNFYEGLKDSSKSEFEKIIEELSNISPNEDNYKDIRKKFLDFLKKGINALEKKPEKQKGIILYKAIVDNAVRQKYLEDLDNVNSQFIITEAMHRLPDYKPYIPGSSIKGAIRTALISYISRSLRFERRDFAFENRDNRDYQRNPGRSAEGEILNYFKNIQRDPFRILCISDTESFSENSLIINQTFNYRNNAGLLNKFSIFNEYIKFENESSFILTINEKLLADRINNVPIDAVSKKSKEKNRNLINMRDLFTINTIKQACNDFYFNKLDNDYSEYFSNNNQNLRIISKNDIASKINRNANEFLIRIGRFSQFESMTLDNLRENKNLNSRMLTKFNDWYYPVGWAKIKFEELRE